MVYKKPFTKRKDKIMKAQEAWHLEVVKLKAKYIWEGSEDSFHILSLDKILPYNRT